MFSVCSDNVSKHIKRAGPFLLGPRLGSTPVKSMIHCLARKEGTNEFFAVKVLTLKNSLSTGTTEDQQGAVMLHTEYSLLTMLKGVKGVVQHHGLFKDTVLEEVEIDGNLLRTGNEVTRIFLVLDCHTPHDYSPAYKHLINLKQYVLTEKGLAEPETIDIFSNLVEIVEKMHEHNIVHLDLKPGNITLDTLTKDVTIGNFGLGKHLTSENEALIERKGSGFYVAPDVVCGEPYSGKPCDMWSLGVILYLMLYGQLPFYDPIPREMLKKVKAAEYIIPIYPYVSAKSIRLIKSLLVLNPKERLTCTQVVHVVKNIIATRHDPLSDADLEPAQVVPGSG